MGDEGVETVDAVVEDELEIVEGGGGPDELEGEPMPEEGGETGVETGDGHVGVGVKNPPGEELSLGRGLERIVSALGESVREETGV